MSSIKHTIIQKYVQNTNKMYKSYIGSAQVFHSTDKPRDARRVSMKQE